MAMTASNDLLAVIAIGVSALISANFLGVRRLPVHRAGTPWHAVESGLFLGNSRHLHTAGSSAYGAVKHDKEQDHTCSNRHVA